jgi:hypothetical protein
MASTMTKKSFLPDCKVLAELSERCESESLVCVRLVAENRPSAGTSQVPQTPATEICWQSAQQGEKTAGETTRISPDPKLNQPSYSMSLTGIPSFRQILGWGRSPLAKGLVMGLVSLHAMCCSSRQMWSWLGDVPAICSNKARMGPQGM